MQCAVFPCATIGLRRSKSVGLSWRDIDFADGTMNVHASSDEHGNLKEPKIEEGYRILSMPENVIEALKVRKGHHGLHSLEVRPDKLVKRDPKRDEPPEGYVEHEGSWYDIAGDMPVTGDTTGKRPRPHSLSVW